MISYKNSNLFEKQPLIKAEINGEVKYLVTRTYAQMAMYEVKPRRLFFYYSRYLWDRIMYQEIDFGVHLLCQLRSTTHHIVKDFSKEDIIYLNI